MQKTASVMNNNALWKVRQTAPYFFYPILIFFCFITLLGPENPLFV